MSNIRRSGAKHPVAGRRQTSTYRLLGVVCCLLLFAAGCRQDMQDQPRYEAYEPSKFFENGDSSRPLVEGTVARGQLKEDTYYYTGKMGGARSGSAGNTTGGAQPAGGYDPADGRDFPIPITRETLDRGEQGYRVFCSVCHGATGDGDGMIVRRGFTRPPSFNTDQLRQAPVGHFFDAITNGWGAMPDYAAQIPVEQRWEIIAYIRALQLSQNATLSDVPPEARGQLPTATAPQPEQQQHRPQGEEPRH